MIERGPRTEIEMISDAVVRPHTAASDGRAFHIIDAQLGKVNPTAPMRFRITGIDPPGPCQELGAVMWLGRPGPQPAPDIRAMDHASREARLGDLRGKVVVLNLWASWCSPCTKELPSLAALQRHYGKDLVVVALSNDKSWTDARPLAIRNPGPTYWLDPPVDDGNLGPITTGLGTRALPETYLIDREGNIHHWIVNLREWNSPEAHACIDTLLR
jgi:thiol-disulfide isomerase/thioredoxin